MYSIVEEIKLGQKLSCKILKDHKEGGSLQGLPWGKQPCFPTQNQDNKVNMETNLNFQLSMEKVKR